jgi:cytochrome c551
MRCLPGLIGSTVGLTLLLGLAQAPIPISTAAAATLPPSGEGRRLFLKLNCYGCHGMRAAGGMGPNIVGAESGDVNEVVKGGSENGMPSFSTYVTSTDINNLTAYLQSIGTKTEPTFTHWWEAVPSQ